MRVGSAGLRAVLGRDCLSLPLTPSLWQDWDQDGKAKASREKKKTQGTSATVGKIKQLCVSTSSISIQLCFKEVFIATGLRQVFKWARSWDSLLSEQRNNAMCVFTQAGCIFFQSAIPCLCPKGFRGSQWLGEIVTWGLLKIGCRVIYCSLTNSASRQERHKWGWAWRTEKQLILLRIYCAHKWFM